MELTNKEGQQLQELNETLQKLELQLYQEAIKIDDEFLRRVNNPEDILEDYELEIHLEFYLKENHQDYDNGSDNLLTTLNEPVKNISNDSNQLSRLQENHNEFCNWSNHPMSDEYHSWWYHGLYDHTDLDFKDMLNIGEILTEIKVLYQYKHQKIGEK